MGKFTRLLLTVVLVGGSSAFMVASTPSEACTAESCGCPPRQCPGGPSPCPVCPSCGFAQPVTESE